MVFVGLFCRVLSPVFSQPQSRQLRAFAADSATGYDRYKLYIITYSHSIPHAIDYYMNSPDFGEFRREMESDLTALISGEFNTEIVDKFRSFVETPCLMDALPDVLKPRYRDLFSQDIAIERLTESAWSFPTATDVHLLFSGRYAMLVESEHK